MDPGRRDRIRSDLAEGRPVALDRRAPPDERRVDLRWLVDEGQVRVPVAITGASLVGGDALRGCRFLEVLALVDCTFEDRADFAHAELMRPVRLDRCAFDAGASFCSAVFRSDVWMDGASFQAPASEPEVGFQDCHVGGMLSAAGLRFAPGCAARLDRATFARSVVLSGATFGGRALFSDVQVGGWLRVDGAVFAAEAVFDRLAVGTVLHAEHARFEGASASFADARAGCSAILDRAEFAHDADFSRARVEAQLSFRHVRVGELKLEELRAESIDLLHATVRTAALLNRCDVRGRVQLQRGRIAMVSIREARLGSLQAGCAVIARRIDLSLSTITGQLAARGVTFEGTPVSLRLAGTSVGQDVALDGSTLAGDLRAEGLRVGQELSLAGVRCGGHLRMKALTAHEAELRGARVEGSCTVGLARISGGLRLGGATFGGLFACTDSEVGLLLGGWQPTAPNGRPAPASFRGDVDLTGLHAHTLLMEKVEIAGRFKLEEARVEAATSFAGARFTRGPASFQSAVFGGIARFDRACFDRGDADFRCARFEKGAHFEETEFAACAKFSYASFAGEAVFGADFRGPADFTGSRFHGAAEFAGGRPTRFREGFFRYASFSGDAAFAGARFAPGARLSLRGACAARLTFSTDPGAEALPASLDLHGCVYQRIEADPSRLVLRERGGLGRRKVARLVLGSPAGGRVPDGAARRDLPPQRQLFDHLEAVLRGAGDRRGADQVHLERRRVERRALCRAGPSGWLRYLSSCMHWGVARYGVRPLRLAAAAAAVLVLGTWYFSTPATVQPAEERPPPAMARRAGGWGTLTTVAVAGEAAAPRCETLDSTGEAFMMALNQMLPFSLPIDEVWKPCQVRASAVTAPLVRNRRPTTVATWMKLFGWVMVPLGLGAISGLLRRSS